MMTQIIVFYDDLMDLTQRFSTENHKKETDARRGRDPGEAFRTHSRQGEERISTPQNRWKPAHMTEKNQKLVSMLV